MNKIYVGIDVGKKGAIVEIDVNGGVHSHAIPLINNEIDLPALCDLLKGYKEAQVHVVLEDVHSIFGAGAKSNFQFGRTLGMIEGVLNGYGIPYVKVQPKAWQKVCFQGVAEMKKPGAREHGRGSLDTKAMALVAAQRLYPKANLRKSERARIAHDGIVDALLMAHYGKLKF